MGEPSVDTSYSLARTFALPPPFTLRSHRYFTFTHRKNAGRATSIDMTNIIMYNMRYQTRKIKNAYS